MALPQPGGLLDMCTSYKQRYLLQRTDTEMFFTHPCDVEEHQQWIQDPLRAHQWVDLDSCAAAVRTSEMVWGIPAQIHTICLEL